MKLDKRISRMEQDRPDEKPKRFDLVMIDCSCQVKHPEQFRQVRTGERVLTGGEIIELEPIDPDFTCSCHMAISR